MARLTDGPSADLQRAIYLARRLLIRYAIQRPGDIDIETIAMAERVLVFDGVLHDSDARLVRGKRLGFVRVRFDIPEEGRRRLAIAHELGHWLLHLALSQFGLLCNIQEREAAGAGGVNGYRASPMEVEATVFASELLIPTSLFEPLCASIVQPTLADVRNLAGLFRTTLTATAVRLVHDFPHSFVAFSNGEAASWWKRCENGRPRPFLWLAKQQPVDPRSMAWRCHRGEEETEITEVPFNAWFGHLKLKKRYRLLEQSVRLGHYDKVMSLLTLVPEEV